MTLDELFARLWADYAAITPQAERIQMLLADRGESVRDDHVALRTLGVPGLGISVLARPFEALGYIARERYRFDDKKLVARYWQHPDPLRPKLFASELCVAELSPSGQQLVDRLLAQLPRGFADRDDLAWAGRPWQVRLAEYDTLLAESEYAAWVAAFGFRVNHFTIDVNALTTFPDLEALSAFLVEHGFELNQRGGIIKGSPAACLEQISTVADEIEVEFADGKRAVPSCYYEMARRYLLPTGELFHGFVPASADRLFESTDVRR